jgi:hypothetical protein
VCDSAAFMIQKTAKKQFIQKNIHISSQWFHIWLVAHWQLCVLWWFIIVSSPPPHLHSHIQMEAMSQRATIELSLFLAQGEEYKGILSLPTSPCTLCLHGASVLKVCEYSKSNLFYHWYWAVIELISYAACEHYLGNRCTSINTYFLTHSMEQIPSWEANWLCS